MAKAEYKSAIRSRKLIIGALADLMQEKSLDKITVTDVVRRAEINRGTFYAHFKDIPDVIDHLIQRAFSGIREVLSEQANNLQDLPRILTLHLYNMLEEDLELYRKIMSSGSATMMQNQLMDIVYEYFYEHDKMMIKHAGVLDSTTFRFCAGGMGAIYLSWLAGESAITLDELTVRAEKLLINVLLGQET